MIYFLHIFRWIKNFIRFPFQTIQMLKKDYSNDNKNEQKKEIVLIIGIPKSGTTLLENILENLGYVNQARSFFRIFDDTTIDHPHDLSEEMLNKIPKNKKTFLKRHSHFTKKNFSLIKKYNFKTIFVFRDLKNVLISRYLHVMSSKTHWQYKAIYNLPPEKGFVKSLTHNVGHEKYEIPVLYYHNWLINWKKNLRKDKNFCFVNYEEYENNPKKYIKKINNFLNKNNVDIDYIFKNINRKINKLKLEKNLNNNLNPNTFNKDSKYYKILFKKININRIIKNLKS